MAEDDPSEGGRPLRVLAITGGHRVDLPAFLGMLAGVCAERDWVFAWAEQPAAQRWLRPELAGSFDAVVCHDIPGLRLARGRAPQPVGPDPDVAEALVGLLRRGQGLVFVHHALAGWPGWPGWADLLGGRYHYAPASLRGRDWPDSGFRYADYTARVVAGHPVVAGITDFPLSDELYCCPVFEDEVVPLLRADAPTGAFRETYHEVLGTPRDGPAWAHPPAGDLIGWASSGERSPVVYLQPGDGPATFAVPQYRQLLAQAVAWVAGGPAHDWAAARCRPISVPAPSERK